MDAQCDKMATIVGRQFSRQFITLNVHLCVQHDVRNISRRAGLSAAADTCSCHEQYQHAAVYDSRYDTVHLRALKS